MADGFDEAFKQHVDWVMLDSILNNLSGRWPFTVYFRDKIPTNDSNTDFYIGPIVAMCNRICFHGDKLTQSTVPIERSETYTKEISRLELDGNASFSVSKIKKASGDRCVYEPQKDEICLKGHVTITDGKHTKHGDDLVYNPKTGQGILKDASGQEIMIDMGFVEKVSPKVEKIAKLLRRYLNLCAEKNITKPAETCLMDFAQQFLTTDAGIIVDTPEVINRRAFISRIGKGVVGAGVAAGLIGGVCAMHEITKPQNLEKLEESQSSYPKYLNELGDMIVQSTKYTMPGFSVGLAGAVIVRNMFKQEVASKHRKIESLCEALVPYTAQIELELGVPPSSKHTGQSLT